VIDSTKAARLRAKVRAGKGLSPSNKRLLEEYDSHRAEVKGAAPAPGQPKPGGEQAPPADREQGAPPPPPVDPSVEPPPPVRDAPTSAAAGSPGGGSDWREKWRKEVRFSDDGRQMLCESIALSIVEGLGALCDEMKKAGVEPRIDPRTIAGIYVLAIDDLLPAKARLTPRIGAVIATSAVVGQRYYHHKAITEALAKDPAHQEWLRKQAERQQQEQAQRAAHDAETAPPPAPEAPPQYAAPPPPPEPPKVNGTAIMVTPKVRARAVQEDDNERLY
jgi:hypothetical protein